MRMKNHFHIKGQALNLVLIQRPEGTRKWPISGTFYVHLLNTYQENFDAGQLMHSFLLHLVTPIADYYVLAGVVYQAPDLCSVINSRLVNNIKCS